MLPWNPPSSFSSGNEANNAQQQQQQYRPNYEQHSQQPPPPQQQQGHGQQAQQQQGGAVAGQPPAYPPLTLSSTLHFLQSEHRRYARDRNEWEIERAEMRARIALLEGEKRGNEGALRDLGRRCKMLENALRGERSKFLSSTNALAQQSPSPSGTSSPVHIPPAAASGIPPAKAAQLLSNLNPSKEVKEAKESTQTSSAPESAAMAPSTSSPGVAAPTPAVILQPAGHQTRASSSLGMNGNSMNGTWGTAAGTLGSAAGTLGAGRDPRGKARSRDYLKQCLQEITYLTSATTLNPLSATSYSAPGVPRPRKVLPDHIPAAGAPGVFNVSFPPRAGSGDSSSATVPPPSAPAAAPSVPIAAAFELPPSQQQQYVNQQAHPISKFPSDAASAFVPLKRTISQPGLPGAPPTGSSRDLPTTAATASDSIDPFTPVVGPKTSQKEEHKKAEATSATETQAGEEQIREPTAAAEVGSLSAGEEQIREPMAAAEVGSLSQSHEVGIDPISLDGSLASSTIASTVTATSRINGGLDDGETGYPASDDVAFGDGRGSASGTGDSDVERGTSDEWPALSRVGRRGSGGGKERAARVTDNGDFDFALGGGDKEDRGGAGGGGAVDSSVDGTMRRSAGRGAGSEGGRSRLTAIFAPEGDEGWQDELKRAGEHAHTQDELGREGDMKSTMNGGGAPELNDLRLENEEVELKSKSGAAEGPVWRSRGVLRSHLDAARALCFVEEQQTTGMSLLSGGDDNTVKLWRAIETTSSRIPTDMEPVITYRGHTAPVTSIAASKLTGLVYSASLDSTIRIWRLPTPEHQTYDPYDASTRIGVLEGSSDAVWSLVLFEEDGEERLASIAADGLLTVWDTTKREKIRSWGYEGAKDGFKKKVVPTALCLVESRSGKPQQLAVAYFNAVVKLFSTTGEVTMQLESDRAFDGTSRTQINSLVSHPLKPLLATAHESREISLFDLDTGAFIHTILGHPDPVSDLTFLPASCSLASVSIDSVRIWDSDLSCQQDIALARAKTDDGVLAIVAHEVEPVIAIAGADGCVRLFVRS